MKILIAVPCMDQVPFTFAQSLSTLEKIGECKLAMKSGSLIYTSRNSLAMMAIQMDADFVFWLDSDMVFKSDTLVRMMDTLKKNDLDILTGLYFRRVPPYSPVLFDKLEQNGEITEFSEFNKIPDELFEVGGCGFGCVLVKADLLREVQINYGTTFLPMKSYGEDLACCKRIAELGHKMYCEPSARVGHIGHIAIYPEDHERWKSELMR